MIWDRVLESVCFIFNNIEYFAGLCVIAVTLYGAHLRFTSKHISVINTPRIRSNMFHGITRNILVKKPHAKRFLHLPDVPDL